MAGLRRCAAALPVLLGRDRQLGKQEHPQFTGGLGRAGRGAGVGSLQGGGAGWTCVVTAPTGTAPAWPRAPRGSPEPPPPSAGTGRESRQGPSPVCELSFPECLSAVFRFSM